MSGDAVVPTAVAGVDSLVASSGRPASAARSIAALLLFAVVMPAVGAAAADGAERDRIRMERAAAEARFGQRREACASRFAVTACVDEARGERREVLERLRGEENLLETARRRQRAAERLAQIEASTAREAARGSEAVPNERPTGGRAATRPRVDRRQSADASIVEARPRRPPPMPPSPRTPAAAAANDPAEAARNRAAFERRQQAAQAHLAAAEQRRARREAGGKPRGAPLPVPAGTP